MVESPNVQKMHQNKLREVIDRSLNQEYDPESTLDNQKNIILKNARIITEPDARLKEIYSNRLNEN